MTTFVRNSRIRRIVSAALAFAMVASMVAMPAYAVEPSLPSGLLAGSTNFASVTGEAASGIQGLVSLTTSISPGLNARQESAATYQTDAAKAETLANRGIVLVDSTTALHVKVISPRYNSALGLASGTETDVVVAGLTTASTIDDVRNAINNSFAAIVIPTQPGNAAPDYDGTIDTDAEKKWLKDSIMIDATFQGTGQIRLQKRFAEGTGQLYTNGSFVWAEDNAPVGGAVKGIADTVFGSSTSLIEFDENYRTSMFTTGTAPSNLSLADASLGATVSPDTFNPFDSSFALHDACLGWGSIEADGDFISDVDPVSGQYTALQVNNCSSGYDFVLYTGAYDKSVLAGLATFRLGNGARGQEFKDEYNCTPTVVASTVPTAGAVATWTVTVPAPGASYPAETAFNGVSILFPAEFDLTAAPVAADLVGSFGTTPTVTTSATAEGDLVTITNFVRNGVLTFSLRLKAPQDADMASEGAKIWVHNVGAPWSARPDVAVLQNPAYPAEGTDWVPTFCQPNCGPIAMDVKPDLAKTVTLTADKNRAKGYSRLQMSAVDQFGNDVTGELLTPALTITGGTDGASTYDMGGFRWIWRLADTPAVNTASVTVADGRAPAANLTASVPVDTRGVGAPARAVILPTSGTYNPGDDPAVIVQLVDAQGNPTSWLDDHSWPSGGPATDWIRLAAHSQNNPFPVPGGFATRNAYIWRGWSLSTYTQSSNTSWYGTDTNAWPTTMDFMMSAKGPDTWTFSARHDSGSVIPAAFATSDILAQDPELVGKPDHIEVTAAPGTPADYATGDTIYNERADDGGIGPDSDNYAKSAFGVAAADGTPITLQARIVDAYGNTVANTGNVPFQFTINKFTKVNAVFSTGHIFETTSTADGVATALVYSYEPTLSRRNVPGWGSSWFTPVRVDADAAFGGSDWANPCGSTFSDSGYGFTYFHGARVTADLVQTPECEDKVVALADGVDTTGWEIEVTDSAFDTPIANWDLKFTTSFGSFANGSQAVTVTTDANGKASAPVKSSTAGTAFLRVFDRWRNAFTTGVDFTDYVAKQTVANATGRAGDRATIESLVHFENIKTGQRVQWDAETIGLKSFDSCVYGPSLPDPCDDVCAVTHTNDADTVEDECGSFEVDTDNNGKMDAVRYAIPAYDGDAPGDSRLPLESAGMRYMLPHGEVTIDSEGVDNVFYDAMSFVAAPARPNTEVNFVKEATLMAEGTQLDAGLNLVGSGFTPAHVSDEVKIYLGDITTHGRNDGTDGNYVGTAYVGADGSLMPMATFNSVGQMAPGEYDITVDGLVFKKGLVIKNLFNQAQIKFRGLTARSGDQLYISGAKDNVVQVDAYGALNTEVWMGGVKLANSAATGNFIIPKGRFSPGKYTVTAKVMWPTMRANSPIYGGYTTVVKRDVYVQGPLKFSTPAISASGRTLKVSGKVSGAAEWNGSKAFKVKVSYQRLVNGRWSTVATRYANASSTTGKFASSARMSAAGTYRVVVSHKDNAHPASSKGSARRTVR